MAIPHRDLAGAELHEPKGIETAPANSVYFADGIGSGTWEPISDTVLNLNEYSLTSTMTDISAANGRVYFHVPVKSELVELSAILDGAITTADSILSVYIGGVLFADSLVVPYATSAPGQDSILSFSTPSTITAGTVIEIRSNGASDTTVRAFIQLRLRAKS